MKNRRLLIAASLPTDVLWGLFLFVTNSFRDEQNQTLQDICGEAREQLYFIFYIKWEKTVKNITSCHKADKFQDAEWIFPHELTCQILTNQGKKLDMERDQHMTIVRKRKSICLPGGCLPCLHF